ncbi:MAG: glycoside hydrolase family 88 protein [Lachnospiraceae bacterium]|nr:glycoside hydrolase family 88 protein [Lachnospiraceae bacterium]
MTRKIQETITKAKKYIDNLTVHSDKNIPHEVVCNEQAFFTWDKECRTPSQHPYLFNWSYYNGVIMEGMYGAYKADSKNHATYPAYIKEYLDAMIDTKEDGHKVLSLTRAGYVDHHGGDCYKTAALMLLLADENPYYAQICDELYRDLTSSTHVNSKGNIVARDFCEEAMGYNYWHCWASGKQPKYTVWLDGLYMMQPFITRYAAKHGDAAQLALVQERFNWVAKELLAPNGLYYHAGNSAEDVCNFFWLRAIGWYGMAMVDVMEYLPEGYLEERKAALKTYVDGMLKYQHESGMWANLVDQPVTDANRLETSGTAMVIYTILKAVRNGWLEESYKEAGIKAFIAMTEMKLDENGLHDIYLVASASGANNYELIERYKTNEGKGSGPFIMAYSEMAYMI